MFDPSGLIVGLPGLVTSCADLYKLTVKVRHKNHDVNIVVCRVGVEQMKFACWLEDVGFVEGTKPMLKLPPAAQNVMINLLQGIQGQKTFETRFAALLIHSRYSNTSRGSN